MVTHLRRAAAPAAGVDGKGKGKGKGKRAGRGKKDKPAAPAAAKVPNTPIMKPADLLSEIDAQAYLPEDEAWSMKKDFYNNRWQVKHALLGELSRSWPLHGEVWAAALVLNFCWTEQKRIDPDCECPHEWIKNAPWRG